jgi:Fic family protein
MSVTQGAKKPAKPAAKDRGESVSQMEPLLVSSDSSERGRLTDLALELAAKSAGLRRSLPESLVSSLADLVRSMNCYYSNLIEGHDTHPVAIERALDGAYSNDAIQRNLQLEAKAHVAVQQWIDNGGLAGSATTVQSICEIHERFCDALPEESLWVTDPKTKEKSKVHPGQLRDRDVKVGNHIAISPPAVPRFLARFEETYSKLGRTETILAAAAAHHRLAWIHPFLDGNGRVARLMSHATLLVALDTGSIWSIARGLARNVDQYRTHLANCDLPRRNDLDGRGNLSQEALTSFTDFFLSTCIDQVSFMESLMQTNKLRERILRWAEEEIRSGVLPPKSSALLEAVIFRGEILRAETPSIIDASERSASRVVSALIDSGALRSDSTRAPVRLAFPATLASRWMPGLFPEKT